MARSLNPVEKARREAKKKEIKKNKKKRLEQRLEAQKVKEQKEKDQQSSRLEPDRSAEATKTKSDKVTSDLPKGTINHNGPCPGPGSSKPDKFTPKVDLKVARTVPAAQSVIESKAIIFKPKITKFVPASVRTKIAHVASKSGVP